MNLIVGLGNPGQEYATNRHNVGFLFINRISRAYKISLNQKHSRSLSGRGVVSGQEVVLAKPRTYMNESGIAVRLLMKNYGASLPDLLVVCDDMDLPLGKLRLRPEGSAGGHHGMESIIGALGSSSFARLRIGIGRPYQENGANFVLSDFLPHECLAIDEALARIIELLPILLEKGLSRAMNLFNK